MTELVGTKPVRTSRRGRTSPVKDWLEQWRTEAGIGTGLVAVCIAWSFAAPNFLTGTNLRLALMQASVLMLIALGETIALLTGEIDLAIGSMAGLSSVVFADLAVRHGVPFGLAIIAVLAMGAVSGLLIGALRVVWNIPSFITTLGLLSAYQGLSLVISRGTSIAPVPAAFAQAWSGTLVGIPVPIVIAVVITGLAAAVLAFTPFGRHLYAVGGNARVARRHGIRVSVVRTAVFMVSEILGVCAGLLVAAELSAGDSTVGYGYELLGIAGAVVGGVSLFGGAGSVIGAVIGVLFIEAIQDGLTLIGVSTNVFLIAEGALVVFAVWWASLQRRRRTDEVG
ncbi:MAG TPA: ABC transporter permease [Micromonosporaceae bacterium]